LFIPSFDTCPPEEDSTFNVHHFRGCKPLAPSHLLTFGILSFSTDT
jgi:hypothetical protein